MSAPPVAFGYDFTVSNPFSAISRIESFINAMWLPRLFWSGNFNKVTAEVFPRSNCGTVPPRMIWAQNFKIVVDDRNLPFLGTEYR